jgi:hypothetical protein
MLAAEFGTGQVFWSLLYFFLFVIWLWLLITVFGDIFRSRDLSGGAKALWCVLVIVLPYIGVFAYLIARGRQMGEHAMEEARVRQQVYGGPSYQPVPATNGAPSSVDQLAQLASLRADGVIDDAEFERMKAKVTAA